MDLRCLGYGCDHIMNMDILMRRFSDELMELYVNTVINREIKYMEVTYRKWMMGNLKDDIMQILAQMNLLGGHIMAAEGSKLISLVELDIELGGRLDALMAKLKNLEEYENDKVIGRCQRGQCNGYIMASEYKCLLCDGTICDQCGLSNDDNHECIKEDIESFKLINDVTKRCPSCKISIDKAEGCNHMYCTECKTAFDWETLEVLKKNQIQNPEMQEDPSFNNYGCFLNGNLSIHDIKFFPSHPLIKLLIHTTVIIEDILSENDIEPYSINTYESMRIKMLDRGTNLEDENTVREFRTHITSTIISSYLLDQFNQLIHTYTRIVKDLLINIQRQYQDNPQDFPSHYSIFRNSIITIATHISSKIHEFFENPSVNSLINIDHERHYTRVIQKHLKSFSISQ